MQDKYVVSYNVYGYGDFLVHRVILIDDCSSHFNALIKAQNNLKENFNDGWHIRSSYMEIELSNDGENYDYSYTDFTVRMYGHPGGYDVQYVINCSDGNDTIALVKHPNMVCEDVAREEFYAMMEEINNG